MCNFKIHINGFSLLFETHNQICAENGTMIVFWFSWTFNFKLTTSETVFFFGYRPVYLFDSMYFNLPIALCILLTKVEKCEESESNFCINNIL